MIVDRIETYLHKLHNEDHTIDLILKGKVKALLDARVVDSGKWIFDPMVRKSQNLYPSDSGKCPRQIGMKILDFPAEPMGSRVSLTFTIGNYVEAMVLALAAMATPHGIVENNEKFQVMIGGKPRRGATDGLYVSDKAHGRVNVEIKSMTQYGFKEFQKAGLDNTFGYESQVNVYERQLVEDKKIDSPGKTCVIAVDKMTGSIAESMHIYDERIAVIADENFKLIDSCLERNKIPKIPPQHEAALKAKGELGLVCSYCRYKFSCWSKPFQKVDVNGAGKPLYSDKTERWVGKTFKSGRFGQKPVFHVKNMDETLHAQGIDGIREL